MSLGSGGVCVGAGGVQPRGAMAGPESSAGSLVSVAVLAVDWSVFGGSVVWQAVRRRRATQIELDEIILMVAVVVE